MKILRFLGYKCHSLGYIIFLCTIALPSTSEAQTVVRGPSGIGSFGSGISGFPNYSLAPGVDCPSPSFGVTAFGGNAGDYGNASDYVTSNFYDTYTHGGNDTYGVSIGFNVPLGGDYAAYCTKSAEIRKNDLQMRLDINEIKRRNTLITACLELYNKSVLPPSIDESMTKEQGAELQELFGPLLQCKAITTKLGLREPVRQDELTNAPSLDLTKKLDDLTKQLEPIGGLDDGVTLTFPIR